MELSYSKTDDFVIVI